MDSAIFELGVVHMLCQGMFCFQGHKIESSIYKQFGLYQTAAEQPYIDP